MPAPIGVRSFDPSFVFGATRITSVTLSEALVVFLVMLALLHYLLIRRFKIGKVGWKIVDYIWLAIATLSIVGATAQARNRATSLELRAVQSGSWWITFDESLNEIVTDPDGLCAAGIFLGETPQNADDYTSTCKWFKDLKDHFSEYPPSKGIDFNALPREPSVDDGDLKSLMRRCRNTIADLDERKKLLLSSHFRDSSTAIEDFVVMAAPVLGAIALALRVTKVTAEITMLRRSP